MMFGQRLQLATTLAASPFGNTSRYTKACAADPRYTNPSMMPVTTPAFFVPPKSADAVPDNMPWTPITHSDMKTIDQPTPGEPSISEQPIAPTSIPA